MEQKASRNSSDFVSNLQFSLVETYSLLRCERWIKDEKIYRTLSRKHFSTSGLAETETRSFKKLRRKFQNDTILSDKGNLHPTAEKICSLKPNDDVTNRLISILSMPAENVPDWMCAPIYRDAILFRDETTSTIVPLNICFSCDQMISERGNEISTDEKSYRLLTELFIELGHDILND